MRLFFLCLLLWSLLQTDASFANQDPRFSLCRNALENLSPGQVKADAFVHEITRDPLQIYKDLDKATRRAASSKTRASFSFHQQTAVLLEILADVNQRLNPGTVLELPQFE